MRKSISYILVLLLIFSAAGCATIVQGTKQRIEISSDPQGATVEIDGEAVGTTPMKIKLKTPFNHTVVITKEGYKEEKVALSRAIGSAAAGNIFIWGPVGWAVDGLTGSQYRLVPDKVHVELKKEE
ncbi:MAG: PEGA domain-containing protein [Candidatus Omnitrophica bacterium]|nr:PEGA domain-containing protein [Candidatus Omnitrophota bacterium]MBU4488194.1 PEGA domain-containing protein [Candidatus Omnitrophota bacterium]MCG2705403.1 PEGA domain-containing protein [Candidatus Omnitrophota bacterium]